MYPKMKRLIKYILIPLLFAGSMAYAQEVSRLDSISLGNAFHFQANVNQTSGRFGRLCAGSSRHFPDGLHHAGQFLRAVCERKC